MAKVWNDKDNVFLRDNYMNYNNQELADMFQVTKKSIQGKLRRLGLHRKEEGGAQQDSNLSASCPGHKKDLLEDRSLLRRKRLNCKVPVAKVPMPPHVPFRPVEMTERRKRAIREFSNAIEVMNSGDKEKARQEFIFVRENFPKELDIAARAESWIKILSKPPASELKTPEDHYIRGVELVERSRLDEALGHFNKALELDPDYEDAEYNIACIYCRLGQYEKALDILWYLSETNERYIEAAMNDEDFEPIWQNKDFIDLIREYCEETME
ncbi:MAG: tetratricopeptide repeat protein [bacterium]